ncbi:unnamed protein product [Protopolystoma xenopodis]|uniref:Uncharacterized protein n=1 Tax=Protopolystoma xenopodis TaxID=117903 RepID=A0A448XFI2_9PLAT|nr:unnamed protein product [Protopolystoma xenopodis]
MIYEPWYQSRTCLWSLFLAYLMQTALLKLKLVYFRRSLVCRLMLLDCLAPMSPLCGVYVAISALSDLLLRSRAVVSLDNYNLQMRDGLSRRAAKTTIVMAGSEISDWNASRST